MSDSGPEWADTTDAIAAGVSLTLPEPIGGGGHEPKSAAEVCQSAWEFFGIETGEPPDLRPMGVSLVDDTLGGIAANQLTILAASPGVGKSTFALQCAYHAAKRGTPTGLLSLEDGSELLGARLYSILTGVDDMDIRMQQLQPLEIELLKGARGRLQNLPLYMVDANVATTDTLITDFHRLANKGCKVVWVDYVQRITVGAAQSERMALKHILALLQEAARSQDVTLVLISQLGRAYKPEMGPPEIYHLEGCSGLEQQARLVVALYPRHNGTLGFRVIKSTVGGEDLEEQYIREGSRFRRLG